MKHILSRLYQVRYGNDEVKTKEAIWNVLCSDFLQKFVEKNGRVLDIAAGHCEFINNIQAKEKYAIDIDKRIQRYAASEVRVHIGSATRLPKEYTNTFDTVFMGCFLEHLPSKQAILEVLKETKRALKMNGRLLILNPNIRFSTADYWDYFDHLTPVSDRSVAEALQAIGFEIEYCVPKFVPNTIKDNLPKWPFLVKVYLHLPFLFPIFGKQMFIVAKKR